jgi:hypothetical protein
MRTRSSTYAGALVVAAILYAGYFLLSQTNTASVSNIPSDDAFATTNDSSSTLAPPVASKIAQPPNTKQYQSNAYHFSLFYPDNLTVTERPGAGGSMVLLFEDLASQHGFDIFIVPYAEPKITQERFAMDEPSGVMQDPQNVTIDGAPATEFFSTNQDMGASREIWFLHGGFLYEVTAPQSLDSWLLQTIQTWQFR